MFRCALSMGIIMECILSHIGRVVCAGVVLEKSSGGVQVLHIGTTPLVVTCTDHNTQAWSLALHMFA